MFKVRWWLVKKLLGRKTVNSVLMTLDQAMEDLAGCVTDPEMHKSKEDLAVCAHVRRQMLHVERILSLEYKRVYDKFYTETWWLTAYEEV